jgi:hypothetical protein
VHHRLTDRDRAQPAPQLTAAAIVRDDRDDVVTADEQQLAHALADLVDRDRVEPGRPQRRGERRDEIALEDRDRGSITMHARRREVEVGRVQGAQRLLRRVALVDDRREVANERLRFERDLRKCGATRFEHRGEPRLEIGERFEHESTLRLELAEEHRRQPARHG